MRKTVFYPLLLTLIVLVACQGNKTYVPQDLIKLNKEEIRERLIKGPLQNPRDIVYRMSDGSVVPYDSIRFIPEIETYTADIYTDEQGTIVEQVFRKMSAKEKAEAEKEIAEFKAQRKRKALEEVKNLPLVEVDCDDLVNTLEKVYDADQDTRLNGGIDDAIDRENLQVVISIIKKCGLPTTTATSEKSMSAIWLVFQHSPHEFRKAYFPMLKEAAALGEFRPSSMALMEDRILMGEGEPQIYGSQLRGSGPNGEFELWKIKDPEYVNQRRAEVGLGPLEEYVARWGVEFNVPQKQK